MDALRDWQVPGVPVLVALLLMRGNGIMDKGLDATGSKVLLQLVTAVREYREEVVNVVLVAQACGQRDVRIMDVVIIIMCNLLAHVVALVEMAELHVEHGSLNAVQPAVPAHILEDILPCGAIVGKGADSGGELLVVGRHASGIAKGTEVLAGIETVSGGIA